MKPVNTKKRNRPTRTKKKTHMQRKNTEKKKYCNHRKQNRRMEIPASTDHNY